MVKIVSRLKLSCLHSFCVDVPSQVFDDVFVTSVLSNMQFCNEHYIMFCFAGIGGGETGSQIVNLTTKYQRWFLKYDVYPGLKSKRMEETVWFKICAQFKGRSEISGDQWEFL